MLAMFPEWLVDQDARQQAKISHTLVALMTTEHARIRVAAET